MRILHLVHQYLPEYVGGTELYTRSLARKQVAAGHDVAVAFPSAHQAWLPAVDGAEDGAKDGIALYPLVVGERSRTAVFAATVRQPKIAAAWQLAIDDFQPDIVHIQHLMGIPATVVDVCRARSLPYIITLHDYWFTCSNAQLLTNTDNTICEGPDARHHNCARCLLARGGFGRFSATAPFIAPLLRQRAQMLAPIIANAAAIIAPTHFVRHTLSANGFADAPITVIPHGIEPPTTPVIPEPHADFHVAYIGGLAPQKGVHHLINAFNQLGDGCRLTIVGDEAQFPDYVAELRQAATHAGITFFGRLPHNQLWDFLATVDLVAVPTIWYETASLIIQEAFAARVPVIASDIGALKGRVRDGIDGVRVAAGDETAWANMLRELSGDPARMQTLRDGIVPVMTLDEHYVAIMATYNLGLKPQVNRATDRPTR